MRLQVESRKASATLGTGEKMHQHLLRLLLVVGHLLPQLDGRAAVVGADEQQGRLLAGRGGGAEQWGAHRLKESV